jgi:cobalamin synthase
MTQAPPGPSIPAGLVPLRTAVGLFTVIPVRAAPRIGRDEAARAVLWLPAVGVLLTVPVAGVLLAA